MTLGKEQDLKVKLRSGGSLTRTRPVFTYNSKCIVIASGSNVKVYSTQSSKCIHTLKYHKERVVSIQKHKSNHLQVFSCSQDGIIVRWDHTEGKVLQVYDLQMVVASFYIPSVDNNWLVIRKMENQDHYRLYSCVPKQNKFANFQMLLKQVLPRENGVACGFEGKFVAAVHNNALSVYDLVSKKLTKHLSGERLLECVTCHPSEFVIATGDNQGRVLVWSNIFQCRNPIKSIYHWHTLPVADITFSTEGSYLYSGGGESALVKWNLFSDEKSVLPRLGAPICQLAISDDNSFVITAHRDNSLQIINSQNNVVQVIQGLTQGYFHGAKGKTVLPTGLLYDSLTKALVMNGRPGHLQFIHVHEDKQLFNLDISGRNIISQERGSVVLNTDIQKAAFDEKGYWLATTEYWDDGETSPQIWLKFWEYDVSKQTYVLNTNVILPHNKELNCITFQPQTPEDPPRAVTTSNDCRFKVWTLQDDARIAGKQSWTCESMGCYRDLQAGDSCFSEDGSLLAVAFGNVATLWTIPNTTLKAVLCHERNSNYIKQLVFGKKSCCHLLICHDGSSITVWNVLSLSISFIVHTEVQKLVADFASSMLAVFCGDQTLTLFNPDNPEPIHSIENVSDKPIIAAIFVPSSKGGFHEKSQLFFFDADQNLFTLTDEDEIEDQESEMVKINQNLPVTPFGMLQAESKVTNVETYEPEPLVDIFMCGNEAIDISCPTLIDPLTLCSKILKSSLIPRQKINI